MAALKPAELQLLSNAAETACRRWCPENASQIQAVLLELLLIALPFHLWSSAIAAVAATGPHSTTCGWTLTRGAPETECDVPKHSRRYNTTRDQREGKVY